MSVPSIRVRIGSSIALALAVAAVVATSASAAGKPYTVVLSPASVSSGSVTITATLTNRTGTQQLGSANLTAPSQFTVTQATLGGPGTATIAGKVVQLRNLSLAPGASRSVTLQVDTSAAACSAGSFAWTVLAKQANDFNGPPGNNLDLDTQNSALTTTVTGGCGLRFFTPPADANPGQTITGTAFNPSGPPVAVEVVDGAGNRVTTATPTVTMALDGGPGSLSGTKIVQAANGLASFGDLSINTAGTYRLVASAPGFGSITSGSFSIGTPCIEDIDCSTHAETAESIVDVTAFGNTRLDAGVLQLSLDTGFKPDCVGYTEFSSDWAQVVGPDRSKLLRYQIDKTVMNRQPNNGASFLQMCFAAPFPFATRPGTPLTPVGDMFVGLLPDCGVEPCVDSRSKTKAGDGVITAKAPGGPDDPAYRP
jgi:hypothetical protein